MQDNHDNIIQKKVPLQDNHDNIIQKKVPLQDNHDNIIQKKVPLQDNDDDTIQKKVPLQDEYDADMTLLWEEKIEVNVNIETPELISPLTGKILLLDKDKILIGRANDTDMMLIDDYISRYHLELRKTPLGYTLKNIGTNDILIEKQIIKQQTNIQLEQKILANNNTTVLSKETTIYIGDHILYYIPKNTQQPQTPASQRIQTQKYHFYQGLAEQKRELLEAAQMQKYLTPSRAIFDNLGIGMWFQYMAINDLSGDFFLYHKEEDSIYFCLGDVSGHGSAAALLANQISGMFRILAQQQQTTEDIIKILNQNIYNAKRKTHNLYALINALKVTQNRIDFSIAGNAVPPLYYNAEENKVISLDTPSTPAGLLTSEHFKIYTDHIDFKENDLLILFTDGVTEAQMHDKSLLEYERTQEQLTKQIQEYTILENFLENFLIWLKKNSEIKDDLSIVLIGKLPTT
ncbi:MAG: SpoIIE family protein phosphatase [Planctomycetes bacterium]|nr:SpoIIE family protein phosphatase [Planctomycetota bacterium]